MTSMNFFLDEILSSEELKALLLADPETSEKARLTAEKVIATKSSEGIEPGMFSLFVFAHLASYTLELHRRHGIPHEITVATLRDVNNWTENYRLVHGKPGLFHLGWLTNHALGNLFRLGRLQFIHAEAPSVVPSGKHVIEVHIPQGEPLDINACLESLDMAREFMAKLYPDQPADYFVCGSWLLSPQLPLVSDESSNVCRFMRLWTQLPNEGDKGRQALERVFGFDFDPANIASAPEDTSLRRRLKALTLAGGAVESSFGCIKV